MRQGQLKEIFEGYSQSTRCKGGGGAGRDGCYLAESGIHLHNDNDHLFC